MKKEVRGTIIIVAVIAVALLLFTSAFIALFYWLQEKENQDPYNMVCVDYIYDETDIEKEYGNIIHVGKIIGGVQENENSAQVICAVKTKEHNLEVCVNVLIEEGEADEKIYTPISYEVIKVRQK